MGYVYSIDIIGADQGSEVAIPNLQSLHGRLIWFLMQRTMSATSQVDENTRQAIDLINSRVRRRSFNFDEPREELEQALGVVAVEVQNRTRVRTVFDLLEDFDVRLQEGRALVVKNDTNVVLGEIDR